MKDGRTKETHMTPERMKEAGKNSQEISFSHEELEEQIQALNLVIPYLKARGDCGLMLMPLEISLEAFVNMKSYRESEAKRQA